MNKIVSFLVVLVLWQTDVFAANADSIATSLHRAYRILNESPTEANQRIYFNAFPSTWRDFMRLEDQMDNLNGSDLHEYIKALEQLTAIEDTVFAAKLVNLSIGAEYDADGANYMQSLIRRKMMDERFVSIVFWYLSNTLKGDQMRFWQFYWSSLYFEEDNIDQLKFRKLIKTRKYRRKKGIGFLHMSQEMSIFKVRNKKTHYTNASAQSYTISVRDKHIFQEK